MAAIQIRKAKREGARLLIALAGWTGSGKTVTAIHLAYGLANFDPSKVGFLDCENRRGSLNADELEKATRPTKEEFLIADLFAPFSPQRYIDAIHDYQRAGVEVLIVDSGSHEWEGTGGCIEISDADKGRWNKAKAQHKRFVNALLQTDMHIILCLRAREKDKPEQVEVDGKTKTVYQKFGLQPITEKNLMFDATVSLMMYEEGTRQVPIKVPGALRAIMARGEGYITADDGKAIRDWVDGAKQLDPKIEAYRNRLISNTEGGSKHIEDCWAKTPESVRKELGNDFYGTLLHSAKSFDEINASGTENQDGRATDAPGSDETGSEIAAIATSGAATADQPRQDPPAAGQQTAAATPPAAASPPTATATGNVKPQQSTGGPNPPPASVQPGPATRTPTPAQSANRAPRTTNHPPPATPANRNAITSRPTQPPATAQAAAPADDKPLF